MKTPKTVLSIVAVACLGLVACGGSHHPETSASAEKIEITTSSEAARESFLKGRKLLEDLRFTDANEHFQAAVETDPDFASAWVGVANTSASAPEFFAAMRHAIDHMEGASEGEKMQIRAFEAAVNGEPEIQLAQIQALVEAFPNDERAHNAMAAYHFGRQEYDSAIAEYRAAIAIDPTYAPPYNQLGYALRSIGDYAGAEEAFVRYTELIPDQPNPYDSYAELLMKTGRFDDSISQYQKALEINPNFVASYVGIANNQMLMGETEAARSTLARLEGAARNDGERRQACTWSAASYLYDGEFDQALAEVKRRYEIAKATEDNPAMSADLNLQGNILLRAGRTDGAETAFKTSVDLMLASDATDEVKAATERNHDFNMARVALWRGDVDSATAHADTYRKAVAEHNIRFEVFQRHMLDGSLALAAGDTETAISEFNQANQQDSRVLLLKAQAFAAAGNEQAARAACQAVIDFNQLDINLGFTRNNARSILDGLS